MSHDNVQKMRIQAAVLRESGAALKVEDVLLEAPRPTEVRVRVVASGVCHTDMVVRDQLFPTPMPIILGHEGQG